MRRHSMQLSDSKKISHSMKRASLIITSTISKFHFSKTLVITTEIFFKRLHISLLDTATVMSKPMTEALAHFTKERLHTCNNTQIIGSKSLSIKGVRPST